MYEDTSSDEKKWLGSYFIANYFALSKLTDESEGNCPAIFTVLNIFRCNSLIIRETSIKYAKWRTCL